MADDVVYASSFGYDPDDATNALQQALDSTARTVVIDDVGAEWLTRPLNLNRDNVTIIVQPGVTVRAKPGGYSGGGDCLLSIIGRTGVTLSGYAATLAMNKQEYIDLNDGSQWRHVVNVYSSTDVTIEGLTLTGAGGDGIYLGRSTDAGQPSLCQNVIVRNVTCDDNYRNGLSVISIDNLLVEGCAFVNTVGQSPQSGLDFEPNHPDEQLTQIVMRDCTFTGNAGASLTLALRYLAGSTTPMSMLFERLYLGPQYVDGTPDPMHFAPTLLYVGPADVHPGGTVEFRDSLFETAPYSCNVAVYPKEAVGETLTFTRTVGLNWGNIEGHYQNISLLGLTIPQFGGITWDDCLFITDQATPFISAHVSNPDNTTVQGLHGNITVVDPNGVDLDLGPNVDDVTLDIRALAAIPASTVQVQALRSTVCRGAPITLLFTRDSADLTAPLAVRYSLSGTAVERLDTDGCAEMAVIPPGATSVRATVGTRRGTANPPGPRTVTFTIEPTIAYSIGASSGVSVSITD
jgi:hypothetical protein